jgi:hypothetical protein
MHELRPLVSIVVPNYNGAEYLNEALMSILTQDYSPLEVIVIDGASTDDSIQILESISDPRLRWISERDGGLPHALNKGFRLASGAILGWLASNDVYVYKHSISEVVRQMQKYKDADVVYGDALLIDEKSGIVLTWNGPRFSPMRLRVVNIIAQPALFMRSGVFLESQLAEDQLVACDYEYWLRLADQGFRFHHFGAIVGADRLNVEKFTPEIRSLVEDGILELQRRHETLHQPRPGLRRLLRAYLRFAFLLGRLKGILRIPLQIAPARSAGTFAFPARLDSCWRLAFRHLTFRRRHGVHDISTSA